jgi:hypothetical protein
METIVATFLLVFRKSQLMTIDYFKLMFKASLIWKSEGGQVATAFNNHPSFSKWMTIVTNPAY